MDLSLRKTLSCATALVILALLIPGCATLGQMADMMVNLQRLTFKMDSVSGFTVAGIDIAEKDQLTDFTILDGVKLLASYNSKKMPAGFTLNVDAVNPNDGTGGSPKTISTLTSFEWRLLIDGRETVSGNIDKPIDVPGMGQATTIPLKINIDLMEFFKEKGYNDLLNLALALGGANSDIGRLTLDAQPRVKTPMGEITYPGRITIVSREYR